MANHKSAVKRARQSEQQRMRNRSRKTRMKNVVRRFEEALAGKSPENAAEQLKKAASVIAKTASKGVIHKNTASRKISRLTLRVNALQTPSTE
ncbi:MAG TPA: 30S ribosomal protein S20 [Syntrophobacteraceae bacterium]|nr:30S ribosomal protein S20 [Syntrophobacteraceae bacterium]